MTDTLTHIQGPTWACPPLSLVITFGIRNRGILTKLEAVAETGLDAWDQGLS